MTTMSTREQVLKKNMMTDFQHLRDQIVAWHTKRFPAAQREHVALKTAEEVGEVASAINADIGANSATGKGDIAQEAADVIITLMVLMGRWYPEKDLMKEVAAKLDILTDPNSGHRAAALSL